ncbi:MAG: hypothetical protein IJE55_01455, partial [Clostridia bacterium]|nr:hypothetical protein [Clostridia bacterium]
MKRFIALMMVFALSLSLFAGCAKEEETTTAAPTTAATEATTAAKEEATTAATEAANPYAELVAKLGDDKAV